MNLTPKQEAFVLHYFEYGNASKAYRHAYNAQSMKEATINNNAHNLLQKSEITARLSELQAKAQSRTEWSVERVLKQYEEIIEIGLGKKSAKRMVTQSIGGGISETVELDLCDTNLVSVNQALQGISKILGFYKHTVEISTEISLKDFAKEFYLKEANKLSC